MSLTVTVEEEDGMTTFTLSGRLDTHTAPELDEALAGLLAGGEVPSRLVFELSQLVYLSSAGIRSFVRARKAVEPQGGKVALINPQPSVRKVLDIVKAMPPGGIFSSITELDEYLDDIQRQIRDRP
jgi:anti-anti-sigma factor